MIKNYIYISLFSVIIAICSWLSIPAIVPFSLQTFAIFLAINLLGAKKALFSIIMYILLGIIGIPVFTGFRGGLPVIVSPVGGYIIGFIIIPLICMLFKEKYIITSQICGLVLCYLTGTLWFVINTGQFSTSGFISSLLVCVIPYIIPDIIKLLAAFIFSKKINKLI